MSKQLTLSASIAVLSMAAFATVASFGTMARPDATQETGKAPLFELTIGR
ncbi:MAG: hypothetical protein R3E14_04525 [Erythrobacter sp.]